MADSRRGKSKSIFERLFVLFMFALSACGCGGVNDGVRRVDVVGGVTIDMVPINAPSGVYYMQKTEVPQALWKSVMGENPSHFKDDDRPVEQVSLNDCQSFIEKLNGLPSVGKSGLVFRLPTEEEWEYACRAGSAGNYCKLADGTEITADTLESVAWYGESAFTGSTHPVGRKQPNAFGLHDMLGNAEEWTSTGDVDSRVCRGGGFDSSALDCASGDHCWSHQSFYFDDLGLRLAASIRTCSGNP